MFFSIFFFLSYSTVLLWHFKFLLEYQYTYLAAILSIFIAPGKVPNICAALTQREFHCLLIGFTVSFLFLLTWCFHLAAKIDAVLGRELFCEIEVISSFKTTS